MAIEGQPDYSKAGALRAIRAEDAALRQLREVKAAAIDPAVDATDIQVATSFVAVDGFGTLTNLSIGAGLVVTSGVLSVTGGGGSSWEFDEGSASATYSFGALDLDGGGA